MAWGTCNSGMVCAHCHCGAEAVLPGGLVAAQRDPHNSCLATAYDMTPGAEGCATVHHSGCPAWADGAWVGGAVAAAVACGRPSNLIRLPTVDIAGAGDGVWLVACSSFLAAIYDHLTYHCHCTPLQCCEGRWGEVRWGGVVRVGGMGL